MCEAGSRIEKTKGRYLVWNKERIPAKLLMMPLLIFRVLIYFTGKENE
jgi:hypothetical protein